jgi:hypothetical protein
MKRGDQGFSLSDWWSKIYNQKGRAGLLKSLSISWIRGGR